MNRKTRINTIAEKNRIIDNIINVMLTRDNFLLVPHRSPDEDAISSMVAFGLLLNKFNKTSYILACGDIQQHYQYLLNICRYNSITVIDQCDTLPPSLTTLVLLDTAKPDLLMKSDLLLPLLDNPDILTIEIDHHLEADSVYSGDRGYCLVTEASSTCELIGFLALKLENRPDMLAQWGRDTVLSRNVVLSILTGIIGDSKMGKYLKTARERWFYKLFTSLFDNLLESITYKNSYNLSNIDEIYSELLRLSEEEEQCYHYLVSRIQTTQYFNYVVLDKDQSTYLSQEFDSDTIVTIARTVADYCAEKSGYVSLVSYFDNMDQSGLIQFRMRRNQHYKKVDLRSIIERLSIENGGGHEGAIGFRVDQESIPDITQYVETIIYTTETMIAEQL